MKKIFLLSLMFGSAFSATYGNNFDDFGENFEDIEKKDVYNFIAECASLTKHSIRMLDYQNNIAQFIMLRDKYRGLNDNISLICDEEIERMRQVKKGMRHEFLTFVRDLMKELEGISPKIFSYQTLELIVKAGSCILVGAYDIAGKRIWNGVGKIIYNHDICNYTNNHDNIFHTLCRNITEQSDYIFKGLAESIEPNHVRILLNQKGDDGKTPLQIITQREARERIEGTNLTTMVIAGYVRDKMLDYINQDFLPLVAIL